VVRLPGKEFTSCDVAAAVRELRTEVSDTFVSNVYQLDSHTVLLKLHKTDKPAIWLVLEAGRRVNLTAYASEKPSKPPAFCMGLRKYLRSARLLNLEQYEFERVLVVSFKGEQGLLKLILELFGEGNIILVDERGEILQALVYKRMRDRDVVRGEAFKFAPSGGKNPLRVDNEMLRTGLQSYPRVEVVRGLARFVSIGGVYAEEVLTRAGIDKTKFCNLLSEQEIRTIHDSLESMLSQVTSGTLEPYIVSDQSNVFVDAVPLRLLRYGSSAYKVQAFSSFNQALDEFYSKVSVLERVSGNTKIDTLEIEVKRLERIIADQQNVVAVSRAQAEQSKHIGDIIYGHFSELQTVLDRFQLSGKGSVELDNIISLVLTEKKRNAVPWVFFEGFDKRKFAVKFCIEHSNFSLSLKKTLFESAAGFYEHSKRAKQKMEGAQAALNDSLKRLHETQTKIDQIRRSELVKPTEAIEQLEKRRIKQKEWFEKFRWFTSSDGFLVVAGKDAVTNEILIKKHTDEHDVVFHADIIGAPFVVVKTNEKEPSERCLREAGDFAAAFSRAWREGFASVDVYWVRPDQLSKSGPSGESVGHGAFVVRGQRNWMRGIPLRIAIGVLFDEAESIPKIEAGPVDLIKSKTLAHVVIVPGNFEGRELFKRILKVLSEKVPKEKLQAILRMPVEMIREHIPFGKGAIQKD
jgi:predicted ribosome quality control (RQC) complex YloA/Tae2 family protein